MARTPLFGLLRRSFGFARIANSTGRPAAEVSALARERRLAAEGRLWSRRELLATSAAAAAGMALGCRSPAARPTAVGGGGTAGGGAARGEVVVIGAGLAGLTCAYRLAGEGVPVRVLEAQERVGGRCWSLRGRFPEGQVCELGGELIDSGHETVHRLCGELGLALDDFDRDDPALAGEVWFFDGRRVADHEVVEAFRPLAARIEAAVAALGDETPSHRRPALGAAVDRQSIAEWLDGAGVEGWFRRLLDVAYTTEYGLETDRQSAWNLLLLIDPAPDPFSIFGDSDERYHVRGGNDLIASGLAAALAGSIETGTRLEAIGSTAGGRYRLSLAGAGGTRELVADRVVLTLPFTLLREVRLDLPLPAVKRRAIDELGYGTNAKLMVGFSRRFWRHPGGSNGSVLTELPFQLAWESTRLQPGRGGILVAYGGGRRGVEMQQGTPAEQAERFTRQLAGAFPEAGGEAALAALRTGEVRFHWPSFRWTRGSYACYLPGQWTGISGAEGERVGALHFAGEHTSPDFQGFMEGACASGERVAGEIFSDLGIVPGRSATAAGAAAAAGASSG